MTHKTVNDVFKIIHNKQITEEEIYHLTGTIPIYTGRDQIIGYTNEPLVSKEDLPCISYPTKGNIGNLYYKDKLFSGNNTAVLVVKDEYKERVNLMWFIYTQGPAFKRASNSKFGVPYLGKKIVERIAFDLPDKDVQDRIEREYHDLIALKQDLSNIIDRIDDMLSITVEPTKK